MIANADSIVQNVIQIKNRIMINTNAKCKKYRTCKKEYSWNPSTCICENGKYLKSIAWMKFWMLQIMYQQMWQMLYQQIWKIPYQQMSTNSEGKK